uniref:Uncharacterized protein n=1 Tax=Panagrellus redivivus TaxID=6233 RepID=A0A7E4VN33_PANRE
MSAASVRPVCRHNGDYFLILATGRRREALLLLKRFLPSPIHPRKLSVRDERVFFDQDQPPHATEMLREVAKLATFPAVGVLSKATSPKPTRRAAQLSSVLQRRRRSVKGQFHCQHFDVKLIPEGLRLKYIPFKSGSWPPKKLGRSRIAAMVAAPSVSPGSPICPQGLGRSANANFTCF